MFQIPHVFQRDLEAQPAQSSGKVTTPGCEWVTNGEGTATVQWDGQIIRVSDGLLFKRFDRTLTNPILLKSTTAALEKTYLKDSDFSACPEGWEPFENTWDPISGVLVDGDVWPGWLRVNPNDPADHVLWDTYFRANNITPFPNGTYECVGPTIKGNPHQLNQHYFLPHHIGGLFRGHGELADVPRTFKKLKKYLSQAVDEARISHPEFKLLPIKGIVFYHPDGQVAKVQRTDFGLDWPAQAEEPASPETEGV